MNITPKGAATAPTPDTQPNQTAQDARARAIARLSSNNASSTQAQETLVSNPSSISPEEMGALTASKDAEKASLAAAVEGQADKVESPADAASEDSKPAEAKDPLSSQYAVLARKEKALRAKVQAQEATFKSREDALKAKEEQLKAREVELSTSHISKSRLTEDTWNTLQEAGISYDQLTEMALQQSTQDPQVRAHIQRLEANFKAELNAVKQQQEDTRKAYESQQKQSYDQAVNQIRNDAKNLIANNEQFETIAATDSVNDVVELIEETFKQDGILLTVEEAAGQVEEYLVEEAMKLARLKKIQSKLQPTPSKTEAAKPAEAKIEGKQPQPKTITNTMSGNRPLSARERAMLAFSGEKKN